MSKKESSSLLMLCGALQDISEECESMVEVSKSLAEVKGRSKRVSEHIKEVQLMIEKVVVKKKVF